MYLDEERVSRAGGLDTLSRVWRLALLPDVSQAGDQAIAHIPSPFA